MARPTKYTPKLVKKAQNYLETARDKPDFFPSIAGLSLQLEVTRDTIHTWIKDKDKKKFSDTIAEIQALQETRLLEKGLNGTYNSTIAKLMLSSNHGYTERSDHTSKGEKLPTPILGGVEKDNG